MNSATRDTPLFRLLVAGGMPENQAAETVESLGHLTTGQARPSEDDDFVAAVRKRALRGRQTATMTFEDIRQTGEPKA